MELAFEIDKITESIENADTGEVLKTLVLPVTQADLKETTKKNGWFFDWKLELARPEYQVYKLVAEQYPQTIQGMVSLIKREDHVFMNLIENAPFNRGKGKKYIGVCGNLTAFGCKMSKEYGFDGVIVYEPKTALIPHYLEVIMIALNTQEKIDLVLNALEDGEIILNSRERTEEEWAEISRELAELKATRGKSPASEKEWEEFSRELAELKAMQETPATEAVLA